MKGYRVNKWKTNMAYSPCPNAFIFLHPKAIDASLFT